MLLTVDGARKGLLKIPLEMMSFCSGFTMLGMLAASGQRDSEALTATETPLCFSPPEGLNRPRPSADTH